MLMKNKPLPPKVYLPSQSHTEARICSCGLELAPSCMEHLNLLNCELRCVKLMIEGVSLHMTLSRPEQPNKTSQKLGYNQVSFFCPPSIIFSEFLFFSLILFDKVIWSLSNRLETFCNIFIQDTRVFFVDTMPKSTTGPVSYNWSMQGLGIKARHSPFC